MPKALYYVLTVCERSDTYGHSDTPPLKKMPKALHYILTVCKRSDTYGYTRPYKKFL